MAYTVILSIADERNVIPNADKLPLDALSIPHCMSCPEIHLLDLVTQRVS